MFNSPKPLRVVIALDNWINTLTSDEIDSINVIYSDIDSFVRNLGVVVATAIHESVNSQLCCSEVSIDYFLEEELDCCYHVLDDNINNGTIDGGDDYTETMNRHVKNIASAIDSFKREHVSYFYQDIVQYAQDYRLLQHTAIDCVLEDIRQYTIAFLITIRG